MYHKTIALSIKTKMVNRNYTVPEHKKCYNGINL